MSQSNSRAAHAAAPAGHGVPASGPPDRLALPRAPRSRSTRLWAAARLAAGTAVAGLALANGGVAQAADSCPNAAARTQQNATRLPECRAYELASPVDKQGQMVRASRPFVRPDGNAAMFRSAGGMAGTQGNIGGDYVVRRTATGWVTTPFILPLIGGPRIATLNDATTVEALDEEFGAALITSNYPFDPDDRGRNAASQEYLSSDIFRWAPGQAPFWLSRPLAAPDLSIGESNVVWASADLSRVLVRSRRPLSAELPSPSSDQLYLYADGRPADHVSVDDAGAPFEIPLSVSSNEVAVSPDGDTIAVKDSATGRLWVRTDAADPALARTIEPAWGPERRTCSAMGSIFGISADGREVLFNCWSPLRTGDASPTVYRGDVRTGAIVAVAQNTQATSASANLRVVLGVDASDPQNQKIVYADENGKRTLASIGLQSSGISAQTGFSADGRQVVFPSSANLDPRSGGFKQVYRYDAVSGALDCVSCPGGAGVATGPSSINAETYIGDSSIVARRGAISADGRRVFFNSANALAPGDANGKPDAYEWTDGQAHLLGPGNDRTGTAFAYASADGDTAFIYSTENLAPQDIDNGINDLYAVRVDGGFFAPDPAAPCTSGCQGPLPPLEQLQPPGTVLFTGPGDVDDAAEPAVVKVFSVAGIGTSTRARWARGSRAAVTVRLSHAGKATAAMQARIGKRMVVVSRASRTTGGGGTISLPLQLNRRARTVLRKQGSLRMRVRVTVPGAGGAQSASFVLRTAKGKGGGR